MNDPDTDQSKERVSFLRLDLSNHKMGADDATCSLCSAWCSAGADGGFKSTKPSGAPLEVASSDMVMNLNADQVDGMEAADFATTANTYTKAEADGLIASAADAILPRRFYLTSTSYYGDQALSACASGFHMASIWQISDVSSLWYAKNHPDAKTQTDSGSGPPSDSAGWVRTGYWGDVGSGAGRCNCKQWTSGWNTDNGTVASLDPTLDLTNNGWNTWTRDCDDSTPVWCIEE